MSEEENPHLTSITLVQKIRNQYDEKAWERFAEVYTPYIRIIVFKMGMRFHDAEDLVQNVILKAWKGLPNFEYTPDKGRLRGWLKTIARNTVMSHFKKKSTSEKSLDEIEDETFVLKSTDAEINEIMEKEWEIFIAKMAWDNIKGDFGDTVVQVFEHLSDGKSCDEIAQLLDIKLNTVYQSRKRVKQKLFREIRNLNYNLG